MTTDNVSDTPQCDFACWTVADRSLIVGRNIEVIPASLGRKLERELAALRAAKAGPVAFVEAEDLDILAEKGKVDAILRTYPTKGTVPLYTHPPIPEGPKGGDADENSPDLRRTGLSRESSNATAPDDAASGQTLGRTSRCDAGYQPIPEGYVMVPAEDVAAKYWELIYAVGNKHHGETRHETALRYILKAEEPTSVAGHAAAPKGGA